MVILKMKLSFIVRLYYCVFDLLFVGLSEYLQE